MKYFGIAVSIFTLLAIILGLCMAGSPARARKEKFDEIKIQNLSSLHQGIITYWQSKQKLPDKLSDLSNVLYIVSDLADPQSGIGYEYDIVGTTTYKLCAEFNFASGVIEENLGAGPYPRYYIEQDWRHEAGRQCFLREIDANLYKTPR